ncbi:hypothetical protein SeMB42_g03643 [Synchytrium endobioticum]|uniref:Uncharacterized protein n=1 Tax=Synchytrium endobioticum TaxID=286115 RepID=A0A507D5E4_9FUNG|nr:hypothetical protein SeMB42_g03643 [Synchytrium endobioticum]TPX51705.1 hypothetical protein SeLEV6574_g00116 [Synchytrium endobioticum]
MLLQRPDSAHRQKDSQMPLPVTPQPAQLLSGEAELQRLQHLEESMARQMRDNQQHAHAQKLLQEKAVNLLRNSKNKKEFQDAQKLIDQCAAALQVLTQEMKNHFQAHTMITSQLRAIEDFMVNHSANENPAQNDAGPLIPSRGDSMAGSPQSVSPSSAASLSSRQTIPPVIRAVPSNSAEDGGPAPPTFNTKIYQSQFEQPIITSSAPIMSNSKVYQSQSQQPMITSSAPTMWNTRIYQSQSQQPMITSSAPPSLMQGGIKNFVSAGYPPDAFNQRSGSTGGMIGPTVVPRGSAIPLQVWQAAHQHDLHQGIAKPITAFPPPIVTTTAVTSVPPATQPPAAILLPNNILAQIKQLQADIVVRDDALQKWTEAMNERDAEIKRIHGLLDTYVADINKRSAERKQMLAAQTVLEQRLEEVENERDVMHAEIGANKTLTEVLQKQLQETQTRAAGMETKYNEAMHELQAKLDEAQTRAAEVETKSNETMHELRAKLDEAQTRAAGMETKFNETIQELQAKLEETQIRAVEMETKSNETMHESHAKLDEAQTRAAGMETKFNETIQELQAKLEETQIKAAEMETKSNETIQESHARLEETQVRAAEMETKSNETIQESHAKLDEVQIRAAEMETKSNETIQESHGKLDEALPSFPMITSQFTVHRLPMETEKEVDVLFSLEGGSSVGASPPVGTISPLASSSGFDDLYSPFRTLEREKRNSAETLASEDKAPGQSGLQAAEVMSQLLAFVAHLSSVDVNKDHMDLDDSNQIGLATSQVEIFEHKLQEFQVNCADVENENILLCNDSAPADSDSVAPPGEDELKHLSCTTSESSVKEFESQLEPVVDGLLRQGAAGGVDAARQTEELRALLEESHMQLTPARDELDARL